MAVEKQFDRRRVAGTVPEVIPPRTVAARVLVRTAEVKAGEEASVRVRLHVRHRAAEAVVLAAIRHVNAQLTRREDVAMDALRVGRQLHHAVRPRPPRSGGRSVFGLQLEVAIEPGQFFQLLGQRGGIEFTSRDGGGGQLGRDRCDRRLLHAEVVELDGRKFGLGLTE